MKNDSLVIMAGGASSRMKQSLKHSNLERNALDVAKKYHKSLIPLDQEGKPLLYFLLKNAVSTGIKTVYLITSKDNKMFKGFISSLKGDPQFDDLKVKFAIQYVPEGREKPLGTADALQQCLEQHGKLKNERFTVCNGDNLYDVGALKALREKRGTSNALIAYDGAVLGHTQEKIAKFALLDFDAQHLLTDIIEKPSGAALKKYGRKHTKFWVSMNIFSFQGDFIYPFLQNCPIHPIRGEKELPEAVRNAVMESPGSVLCIPRSEKIPDLTTAQDIASFFK
ncbi:MAG: sugar phosphate nucleotidyltransferase [Bacteroidota bacterium]